MKKFAAAIAAVGVLCVGAFLYLDHARGGIIGFTMKRALQIGSSSCVFLGSDK
jgi:hypothetical protein